MGYLVPRMIHLIKLRNRMHERIMDPSVASKEPLCTKKAALDMEIDNMKPVVNTPNANPVNLSLFLK